MAKRPGTIVCTLSRISFPHLWEKVASVEGGKEKYRCTFLLNPESATGAKVIEEIETTIKGLIKEAWGANAEKIYKTLAADRKCLQDGDNQLDKEGEVRGGYAGMKYVTASADKRPQVLDRDKTPLTQEDDKIYAGCYADGIISVWVNADSKKRGGYGVFASLELIRFRKDGEPFGAAQIDGDDYLEDLNDDEDEDDVLL